MKQGNPHKQLEFVLDEISRLQKRIYNDCYRNLGVNSSMVATLVHLSREPEGLIQSEIAERLEIGKAATGTLINKLEDSKYIVRKPAPHDKRVWILKITPRGRSLVEEADESTELVRKIFRKNTTKQERSVVIELLDKMRQNLRLADDLLNEKAVDDRRRKFSRKSTQET